VSAVSDQQQTTGAAGKIGLGAVAAGLVLSSGFLINHLTQWESGGTRVLVAYADHLAGGLPTVCNGLTAHVTQTPIVVGQRWTNAQCEAEEGRALQHIQRYLLTRCFKLLPPQSVFDMASSHAWNFGAGTTCGSGAMAAWNRGEWSLGCRRIQLHDDGRPAWSYAGGKFVRGLANRRADEHRKCMRDLSLPS
jgi:lysozyme